MDSNIDPYVFDVFASGSGTYSAKPDRTSAHHDLGYSQAEFDDRHDGRGAPNAISAKVDDSNSCRIEMWRSEGATVVRFSSVLKKKGFFERFRL